MQRNYFRAMNCQVGAIVDAETSAAHDAVQGVTGWFAAWEQCFSRFIAGSELSQLNATHDGKWVRVSSGLWTVLQSATWVLDWSHGLISPLLSPLHDDAWCCRKFVLDATTMSAAKPVDNGEPAQLGERLEFDAAYQMVRLPQHARLDVSGILKGWAAQQAVRRLSAFGPALVDAGGDIAMSERAGNRPWPIEVAAAAGDSSPDLLCVRAGGVATAGREFRSWRAGSGEQNRLNIPTDARTGNLVETDVLTATVMAPDVLMAEAAAKTVFILGSIIGMQWLESRTLLAGSLVLANGQVLRSSRLKAYLWR